MLVVPGQYTTLLCITALQNSTNELEQKQDCLQFQVDNGTTIVTETQWSPFFFSVKVLYTHTQMLHF